MAVDIADEAVVVVPLVLARPAGDGSIGLRPADQALVDGEAAEHPSWSVVARDDRAAAYPRTSKGVRDLQAAGPAADHDDVVVAVRKGTHIYPDHLVAARSRLASVCSMR